MKKFFALALATAMIASMAATAFAATNPTFAGDVKKDGTVKKDGNKTYYPVVEVFGPLSYDDDDKEIGTEQIEYGETAYYALVQGYDAGATENGAEIGSYDRQLVEESETVSSLSIKSTWEEGKALVSGVSIVKKKVSAGQDVFNADSDLKASYDASKTNYFYFLAIKTTSSTSTADSDIIGTLTLKKSKHPKVDDLKVDVAVNVGWANTYNTPDSDLNVTSSSVSDLKAETYYALKFSYDDEVDFEFADGSIFTVDVSGQSKLLVYYDTKFNSKIAAKYPLAELNFWNGNGAKFNRVGEMFIPVKEDYAQFLYQLNADGTLSEVPGAEYDKYDEGFYFYTRVLGTFVISDMELDLKPAVTTPDPDPVVTPPPAVTNPSTGAAA